MSTGSPSSDQQPNLGKTLLDDFRRGDFEQTIRRDFKELKEFMLTEDRQVRLKNMKQVKRWLFMGWWFIESLFLKLTPARRILLLIGVILIGINLSVSSDNHSANFEGVHFIGGLILLFIIALILARGLYRSIQKRDGAAPLGDDED